MEALTPNIASVFFFLTFAIYSLLVIFMLVWVYHDAESRGIHGLLVVLPAFLTGTIFGVVLWLIFRPTLQQELVPVRVQNR
ncbi:hypothetical protein OB13_02395 [Pontibacter sp. HJ8]